MSLDELIVSLAQGNRESFTEIYDSTIKTVYYIALSIVKDRALAEDVAQSTYLKVIRCAFQYREGSNAKAWIARIARNEALNLKKKRSHEVSVDLDEHLASFGTVQTDDYGLLIDLAKRILSEKEFAILMLATVEGYKRREIAQMLALPLPTVTWKHNQAIKKLKHALSEGERREQ